MADEAFEYLQNYQGAQLFNPESMKGLDLSKAYTRKAREKAMADWVNKQGLDKYLLGGGVAPGEFGNWSSLATSSAPEDPSQNPYMKVRHDPTVKYVPPSQLEPHAQSTYSYRPQNVMTEGVDRPGTTQAYWNQYKAKKPLTPAAPSGGGRNRAYVNYLRGAQY